MPRAWRVLRQGLEQYRHRLERRQYARAGRVHNSTVKIWLRNFRRRSAISCHTGIDAFSIASPYILKAGGVKEGFTWWWPGDALPWLARDW